MGKFEYTLSNGSYSDDTRLNIELKVEDGLSPEDYESLICSFRAIEETFDKYRTKEGEK